MCQDTKELNRLKKDELIQLILEERQAASTAVDGLNALYDQQEESWTMHLEGVHKHYCSEMEGLREKHRRQIESVAEENRVQKAHLEGVAEGQNRALVTLLQHITDVGSGINQMGNSSPLSDIFGDVFGM